MIASRHLSLSLLALAALLAACGGGKGTTPAELGDAPDWYTKPPERCGAGVAEHRGNRDLGTEAATGRARDSLSRQLETRVTNMLKNYSASGEADAKDFTEERIQNVSRQVSQTTLVGTRAEKTEVIDQEIFALVCIDPEAFAGAIDGMAELSEKAKAALKERADTANAEMDQAIQEEQAPAQ